MNLAATVAELLSRRLGLSRELLGNGVIERALDAVFADVRPEDRGPATVSLLEGEGEEWQMLVDEVIIPETWFFRDSEPFHFLAHYVAEEWTPANPAKTFQVLCFPCASGEEPYSVAMTLLDAGLEESRIRIDAADVSERALARAKLGIYGRTSFREKSGRFRKEFFVNCEEGRRVREEVARLVHFERANLLDLSVFRARAPYDAIFCRNALIYLDEHARRGVVIGMRELLRGEGVLFTGHAELMHFCEAGFVPVEYERCFACRRRESARNQTSGCRSTATAATQRVALAQRVADPDTGQSTETRPIAELPPGFEQAEQLANRGELDAAAAVCESLLAGGVQNPDVYALLGVINESRGKVELAEEFFGKALYLAPYHYESLLHMGLLCERRGNVEGARLYRERAGRALTQQEENQVFKGL